MTGNEKKKLRKHAVAVGWMFVLLLGGCFLGNLVTKDREFSDTENRALESRPKFSWEQAVSGRLEEKFETYYSDQFLFRDTWVKIKAGTDRLTGKTEANGVYLGKDGYLIENFTAPKKEAFDNTCKAMESFAQKHPELKQYAMIIPNAVNILSQKLPAFAPAGDQNPYLDKLGERLSAQGVTVLDMRNMLSENKDKKLYYQTDHHWTTQAAYLSFMEAGKTMGYEDDIITFTPYPVTDKFRGTLSAKSGFRTEKTEELEIWLSDDDSLQSVINYVDQQKKSASFYDTKKLDTRDAYACFLGGNHPLIKIETPIEQDKKILVLKDSYANCYLPFLSTVYRKVIVVDPRYYYGNLEELIEAEEIEEVLYLYNANTFFSDTALKGVL